jgi:hypothetical protein
MARWFERLIRNHRGLGHPGYRRGGCRGTWRW